MRKPIFAAAMAATVLAACSQMPAASPTPALRMNASTPTLAGGYRKVAAPAGAAVYFVNLKDGDTVTSPFRVVFGVYGMGVAPALTAKDLTGHHHLLIDTELSAEEMKYAIPNDDKHVHYGTGATEAQLMLPAGQHTLQIVFGNKNHEQFSPPIMSKKITINVK